MRAVDLRDVTMGSYQDDAARIRHAHARSARHVRRVVRRRWVALWLGLVLVVAVMHALAGCTPAQAYVAAERATLEAVRPEVEEHLAEDRVALSEALLEASNEMRQKILTAGEREALAAELDELRAALPLPLDEDQIEDRRALLRSWEARVARAESEGE